MFDPDEDAHVFDDIQTQFTEMDTVQPSTLWTREEPHYSTGSGTLQKCMVQGNNEHQAQQQRVSSLTHGAQDNKAVKKGIQEAPVGLYCADQTGREEEEEAENQHKEEAGVDESSSGVKPQ
ncbi:hypothetical protein Q8A73_013418 [Channa argus]|nr:hypothetical protein Q8A73_013418 [Channa argus]